MSCQLESRSRRRTYFTETVKLETLVIKVREDLFCGRVFPDLAIEIEAHHVAGADSGVYFKALLQPLNLGGSHVLVGHVNLEVYRGIGVMLLIVLGRSQWASAKYRCSRAYIP